MESSETTRRSERLFTLVELQAVALEFAVQPGGIAATALFEDASDVEVLLTGLYGKDIAAATINGIAYGLKLAERR